MQREKLLNIEEQTPLWFVVIIVACYAAFAFMPDATRTYLLNAGALGANEGQVFLDGRPLGNIATLFTHLLLHGDWMHVLINAGMILAFGTITIRGVKNRKLPMAGRFERGSVVFLIIVLAGAIVGGLAQWLVWIISKETGIAVGASTAGTALFATTAWALGGKARVLIFGIIVVAYDAFVLSTSGIASGLGNPAWAGHLGGYIAGALLAPFFIKPGSVGIGVNSSR